MKGETILEALRQIEDARFYGYTWNGNDLHLELQDASDQFQLLKCKWAYALIVKIDQSHTELKIAGPLLTATGSVEKEAQFYEVELDFAHSGSLQFRCGEIEVIKL